MVADVVEVFVLLVDAVVVDSVVVDDAVDDGAFWHTTKALM